MGGQTRRVNRGRGHSYQLDGAKAPGVTTIIGDGIPKPALVAWGPRMVAEFVADHLDELPGMLQSFGHDGFVRMLKDTPYNERDKAARRGTEVHKLAEQIIDGDEIDVPDELTGHVDSYIDFLNDWDVEPVLVEGVVVNRRHGYMGTLDLIARLADGRVWLIDLKTTRSGIFGETAIQLAAYRWAEAYVDADGEHPMLEVDEVAGLWVRADGYDLHRVDAGPETFRKFLYAKQNAETMASLRDLVHAPVDPPKEAAA
ncbi:MAG: hypothetical protein AAGA99_26340 [Actinomycetota bacterium]